MKKIILKTILYAIAGLTLCLPAQADEVVYIPIRLLDFTENPESELAVKLYEFPRQETHLLNYPVITLDDPEQTAIPVLPMSVENDRRLYRTLEQGNIEIAFRFTSKEVLSGKISLAKTAALTEKVTYSFTLDPEKGSVATEDEFETDQQTYYAYLAHVGFPGGDWFKFKAGDAYSAQQGQRQIFNRNNNFQNTFDMFSGHRAVSENLALNRELVLGSAEEKATVDVSTIKGITVAPVDWSTRLKDIPTPVDGLSSVIPHDQHAAFFPSIRQLNRVLTVIENDGLPSLESISNKKIYSRLRTKYQTQMGVMLPDVLAEQLKVDSVAITGGDPFLPSGSDLCILFETDNPEALLTLLHSMIKAKAAILPGVKPVASVTGDNTNVFAYANADRSFSSYLFAGKTFVGVSNSPTQVRRVLDVANGQDVNLGSLEEFRFFRQRYPLSEDYSAFVFISDATIRRWGGPEVRIAASRRVRAAAALGHAASQLADGSTPDPVYWDLLGDLTTTGETVQSEKFNTLSFITPISELDVRQVKPQEKQAYETWRRGYENNWTRFDPIGFRLTLDEKTMDLDLSVIPMRLNSRYDDWRDITGEALLSESSITPHPEALVHFAHAIDTESPTYKQLTSMTTSMVQTPGGSPYAWIEGSLSLFIDQDPFWQKMVESDQDMADFIEANMHQIPVGVRIGSKNPAKLAIFVTAVRGFIGMAAPGLLLWETREVDETPYVVVREAERNNREEFRIFYATLPDALVVTMNEDVLKRAIQRSKKSREENKPENKTTYQLYAEAKLSSLKTYLAVLDGGRGLNPAHISWQALPILNEWKKRFPERDPVEVHYAFYKEWINCPGGKGYQWNQEIGSMESVVFGHPQRPNAVKVNLPLFQNWTHGKAGLDLRNQELQLEATLTR